MFKKLLNNLNRNTTSFYSKNEELIYRENWPYERENNHNKNEQEHRAMKNTPLPTTLKITNTQLGLSKQTDYYIFY